LSKNEFVFFAATRYDIFEQSGKRIQNKCQGANFMKKTEQTKPLTPRQLLAMKRDTLEAKIISYYKNTQNAAEVIQYAVAILVKNALVLGDYSFFLHELICELFLTAEPNDVLRRNLPFFEGYFNGKDFDKVVKRLFNHKKEYTLLADKTRLSTNLLNTPGAGVCKNPGLALRLVSIFEDSHGKKRVLTLRDADERRTRAEASTLLAILTTLNIFESEGVRRFAKFVTVDRPGSKDTYEEDDSMTELPEAPVQSTDVLTTDAEPIEIIVPSGIDLTHFSEAELLALVQVTHPEITSLDNVRVVFAENDSAESASSASSSLVDDPVQESPDTAATSVRQPPITNDTPPAAEQKKKNPPITHKLAYRLNLISNWHKKNTGKSTE